MRALFYVGDHEWTGSARVFLSAARGLAARGHQTVVGVPRGAALLEHVAGQGVETVLYDAGSNAASGTWDMRRVMQERFIEVAFVQDDRDQLMLSSAMRLAERGAVIRRVPAFDRLDRGFDGISLKVATAGLLFTTEVERKSSKASGWSIPPAVAPIGVDAAAYDAVQPIARESLGIPEGTTLLACPFEPSGRFRLATVMRSLARLASRHPDLHAVVYGPGSTDEDLRMHAAALGVAPLVTFLGCPPNPIEVMRACDLAWITAEGDGGAYGFLDAMALRLPIIAERSPLSAHYVADGLTGVLLAPGEPAYVASAVATVLAQVEARTTMGNAGRARVQRDFTEAAMIDGFEAAGVAAGDRTKWAVR
jgi:hypothetical protein